MPFESGRRLCVLLEAGEARYAIEASSVQEVFTPKSGRAPAGLELQDLCELLGGARQQDPAAGLVLDVSPTLAISVGRVVEIADVARAPFHQLPASLSPRLAAFIRGAIEHGQKVYLELVPELLAQRPPLPAAPARPVLTLEELPAKALVIESGGQRFGIPLPWVSQVIPKSPGACRLPTASDALEVQVHGQALWPVFSTAALIGGAPVDEPLRVLTELAGQNVALTAHAALGVQGPFKEGELLFLDLQRMFS